MDRFTYIVKSFRHYSKANLLIALGVAISAAVITGGLIIGDSVTHSLEQITHYRLGNTTHVITSSDRYFRQEIAYEMPSTYEVSPVLISEGVVVSGGGVKRANKVQIVGVDSSFSKISGSDFYSGLRRNEIIISLNLAEKLEVQAGDNILVRIKKASLIPQNAPFVSDDETSVSYRATIKGIASKAELGRFSLKNSQTAPYNLFMPLSRINELMEFEGKANRLLINSTLSESELFTAFQETWKPADANLIIRNIELTGEKEVYSERVFLEVAVSNELENIPGSNSIITYFINAISKSKETIAPYSFVSTLPDTLINIDEIIINQWLADDLDARVGDNIKLSYFTIGPLRQLKVDSVSFIVREIVPMKGRYNDETLMPFLPGMSDAGDCGDWEAGIPIDLERIRDKDEDYWDGHKGTPKAYISRSKAKELWANRFGTYTSVRFTDVDFSKEKFEKYFRGNILPESIGFHVDPVKDRGIVAAQNGIDFSQLFIGLSFFILVAAILLSMLLYLLHLENRYAQIGTLSTLGFKHTHIRNMFLIEGVLVSIVGSLIGLLLAVFYTRMVFRALNNLWFDIVRTNVLEIFITPQTLLTGFIISTLISAIVISISINKKLKQQTSDIQKRIISKEKKWQRLLKTVMAVIFFIIPFVVIAWQFMQGEIQNPGMFFMAGGFMLLSLLLFSDRLLRFLNRNTKSLQSNTGLSWRNMARNHGRSLTVIILFAFGTFLVISTGANKQDLFANAAEKTSGTGGFLYYVESTVPVLFDINDPENRNKEGLSNNFKTIQFRKVEGDDASCLNLNRITNPAILGVDAEKLNGHFSFVAKNEELDTENPWQSLSTDLGEVVPAIADQTVIQWGLGMKVGDTLFYQNELGNTLKLKLIGGLAPSLFQGYIIIGNQQFLSNYPTSSGSSVFLIEGEETQKEAISDELELLFRDYGWESISAPKRLAEFYSVTNTYLSIFLALGALGLILGTIGLAIVLARSMMERKSEIALLQAIGFAPGNIFRIISFEYGFLLIVGICIGLFTAILATLPAILSPNTDVSVSTILIIIAIIVVNGLSWIFLLTQLSLKNKNLIAPLRQE